MELIVTSFKEGAVFKDPLFRYLASYIKEMGEDYAQGMFRNMDVIFQFLQTRMEEFFNANPTYVKPAGLCLCYCRPSCCPATIRLSYLKDFITIKSLDHEKNPSKTIPAIDSDALADEHPCAGANEESAPNAKASRVSDVRKEMVQKRDFQTEGSPQRHSEVQ